MAHFWKLYTHEMRKIGGRYLIVLIAFIVLNGVLFLMRRNTGIDVLIIPYTLLLFLILTNAVLIPYIFRKEASVRSDHLSFSYPMHRSVVLLSRYLTSLTLLAVSFMAAILSSVVVDYLLLRNSDLFFKNYGVNDYSQRFSSWEFLLNNNPQFLFAKNRFSPFVCVSGDNHTHEFPPVCIQVVQGIPV